MTSQHKKALRRKKKEKTHNLAFSDIGEAIGLRGSRRISLCNFGFVCLS